MANTRTIWNGRPGLIATVHGPNGPMNKSRRSRDERLRFIALFMVRTAQSISAADLKKDG